jgi:hypothetical protein
MPFPTACLPFWHPTGDEAVFAYINDYRNPASESAVKNCFAIIFACWSDYGLQMTMASEDKHTERKGINWKTTYADHTLMRTLSTSTKLSLHLLSSRPVPFATIEYKLGLDAHRETFLQMIDSAVKRVCSPELIDPVNNDDIKQRMRDNSIPHTPIFAMSVRANKVRLAIIVGSDEIYVDVLQDATQTPLPAYNPTDLSDWYAKEHWQALGDTRVAKRCDQWMWLVCKHGDLMLEALERDPNNMDHVFKTIVTDNMTAGKDILAGSKSLDASTLDNLRNRKVKSESGSLRRHHEDDSDGSSKKRQKRPSTRPKSLNKAQTSFSHRTDPPTVPAQSASTSGRTTHCSNGLADALAKEPKEDQDRARQTESWTNLKAHVKLLSHQDGNVDPDTNVQFADAGRQPETVKDTRSSGEPNLNHESALEKSYYMDNSSLDLGIAQERHLHDHAITLISPSNGIPFPSETDIDDIAAQQKGTRARTSSSQTDIDTVYSYQSRLGLNSRTTESDRFISDASIETRVDLSSTYAGTQKEGLEPVLVFGRKGDAARSVQPVPSMLATHEILADQRDLECQDYDPYLTSGYSSDVSRESDSDLSSREPSVVLTPDELSIVSKLRPMREMPLSRRKQIFACAAPNHPELAMHLAEEFLNPKYP